jgi:hypothetical protein
MCVLRPDSSQARAVRMQVFSTPRSHGWMCRKYQGSFLAAKILSVRLNKIPANYLLPSGLYTGQYFIDLQRETEEKARQPETKLSANAQTRHIAGLRDAKRSRTRSPKPTHGARDKPKQPQPRAGRGRASEPGQRHASRRTRPTDTGTRCHGKGQR